MTQSAQLSNSPQLMTGPEIAKRLCVTRHTVASWCRQGVFPGAIWLGGAGWRIPVASFERFVAERTVPGAE